MKGANVMKYSVLKYDFNTGKVEEYNIFNNLKFAEGIDCLKGDFEGSYDEFVREVDDLCKRCFWSKREYELSVGDAFETDIANLEKVDAYAQLAGNIHALCTYLLCNCEFGLI